MLLLCFFERKKLYNLINVNIAHYNCNGNMHKRYSLRGVYRLLDENEKKMQAREKKTRKALARCVISLAPQLVCSVLLCIYSILFFSFRCTVSSIVLILK